VTAEELWRLKVPYTHPAPRPRPAGCWRGWDGRKVGRCWCWAAPGHEGDHYCECGQTISEADWQALYGEPA
jgi:hypothetical protein